MYRLNLPSSFYSLTLKQRINQSLGEFLGIQVQTHKYLPPNNKNKYAIRDQFEDSKQKNLIELEYGIFDQNQGEFFLSHDAGLFSCLSVTLWSICDLLEADYTPKKINFRNSLSAYQDAPITGDPYVLMFKTSTGKEGMPRLSMQHAQKYRRFDHHAPYGKLDFEALKPLVNTYFNPIQYIQDRIQSFHSQYLVTGQRYVGVCIRGTDKGTEVPHTDSSLYIECAEALLDKGLVDRVFIQTDQAQIYNIFKHRFQGICDAVEDLPRTSGKVVIHNTAAVEGRRITFAQDMLAVVTMMSAMPYVITHTGNVGAWITLMRGNAHHVWQATAAGIVAQSPDTDQ